MRTPCCTRAWAVPASRACAPAFPVLAQSIHGAPLAYLDNAATTQLPLAVQAPCATSSSTTAPTSTAACTR
jgi:selenocysteine lyase/cysteine desulfurase